MQQTPLVLELSHTIDAPPERVFAAMTDPRAVARWWGPRGLTTTVLLMEPTVGGSYRYEAHPPGAEPFHLGGQFIEVAPPHRLVYTFRYEEPTPDDQENVVTLTLRASGDGCEVRLLQQPFATDERLALHRGGWSDSLERLHSLLGRNMGSRTP